MRLKVRKICIFCSVFHGKELGSNLVTSPDKKISRLASTRVRIHSEFKIFHSGERIQKVMDSYAGFTGLGEGAGRIRKEKVADSKIFGYVLTPGLSIFLLLLFTGRSAT